MNDISCNSLVSKIVFMTLESLNLYYYTHLYNFYINKKYNIEFIPYITVNYNIYNTFFGISISSIIQIQRQQKKKYRKYIHLFAKRDFITRTSLG